MEKSAIFINGSKLTSDISEPTRYAVSRIKAKQFLVSHKHWTPEQFEEVSWETLDRVLSGKPPGFRIWLSKQHSNFCATRVQMKRWFAADDDRCPSCLLGKERADHLCRCPNEERTQLLRENTNELEEWMTQHDNTHHKLLYWIPKYILCHGQVRFQDLGPMSRRMMEIAKSQDTIGWRNFMEGRVSRRIATLQQQHLISSSSRLSTQSWMKQLSTKSSTSPILNGCFATLCFTTRHLAISPYTS